MSDLIAALLIFQKYKNERWPTHCEHDELMIVGVTLEEVSEEDASKLRDFGFLWSDSEEYWYSHRFGSA
jgi:hypothetical protein